MEVPLHLIEHVLGRTPQQDSTGRRTLTFQEVSEIVITQLPDFEQMALRTNISLLDLLRSIHNLRAGHSSNPHVVGLTDTTDAGDVALEEEMLGEVGDTLLGDDDVGLPLEDEVAHDGDFFHLLGEGVGHGVLGFELHVGLTLPLLVLQRTVQQEDPRVLDAPPHLGVRDILIHHHTIEDLALIEGPAWDLLDLGVSLDFEVEFALVAAPEDDSGGLEGQVGDEVAPSAGELGADAALQGQEDLVVLVDVDGAGAFVDYGLGRLEGFVVGANNHRRVDVHLDEGLGGAHQLARQDDHGGGAVAHLLVLHSRQLDHALGGGVLHVDLSEDGVPE